MELTLKQEAFCKAYLETGNASEAYRRSYNAGKMTSKTVNETASKLLASPKVATRIDELKAMIVKDFVWSRQDSLQVLSDIARSIDEVATSRIAAVKELNAMHGYNSPSKVKHDFVDEHGNPITGINIVVTTVGPGDIERGE